jgi:hypothetical protein
MYDFNIRSTAYKARTSGVNMLNSGAIRCGEPSTGRRSGPTAVPVTSEALERLVLPKERADAFLAQAPLTVSSSGRGSVLEVLVHAVPRTAAKRCLFRVDDLTGLITQDAHGR